MENNKNYKMNLMDHINRGQPALPYQSISNDALHEIEQQAFNGQLQRIDLLQFLIQIQQINGWISAEHIAWISQRISTQNPAVSEQEIRGIIDFYSFLERESVPELHLHLSTNITDYMLGQQENIQFFQNLAARFPEQFKVSLTSCSGLCDQGPAGLLNGLPIAPINEALRCKIETHLQQNSSATELLSLVQTPIDQIQHSDQILDGNQSQGEALNKVLSATPDSFLIALQDSKLRGRGGAGFPTALKWQTCKDMQSATKVVVCNADEGEPGTFKDRVLLHSHFNQVLEGMTIAAYTVGANVGFIYLRFEYQYLVPLLQKVIQERISNKLLGEDILSTPGFSFNVNIHLGAGAYICGEESALLESLEGKRGIPRIRPPFPAQAGYLQHPTLVNNVETFCCVTQIALVGGDNFAKQACEGSTGTKVHSVSGDCEKPGIYELPFDVSVQDILDLVGAHNTQAVQVGGPSGKLLFPESFAEKVNFSHVSSGGSFMVFDQSRDLFEVVKNFTEFFHHESCGFCTPCRVGCGVLTDTLDRFAKQQASMDEIEHLKETMALMDVTSHCGLGQTAAHPVRYLLESKPEIFAAKQRKDSVLKIDIQEITSDARALNLNNAKAIQGESNVD